ncbi:hypothetical protein HAX54_024415 [Datura stramonium]|uniref:Ninja-family protein n=1 Tax=Datura stramonium TaxID=4076 RepID=A0ABS8UZ55_DATST|nr:hypothetical protein [Datura stramonium]
MEKAEENKGKECVSSDPSEKFMNERNQELDENVEGGDDVELSLGLSLNGRFGVDPNRPKLLNRSSSVTNFVLPGDNSNGSGSQSPLPRTCSLPAETEEEWRKGEDVQSLRCLEAMKKRLEKMKNVRVVQENEASSEKCGNPLLSSGGSQGSVSSGTTESESQQPPLQVFIAGPRGSVEAKSPDRGQSPKRFIAGPRRSVEADASASGQSPKRKQKPVATAPEAKRRQKPVATAPETKRRQKSVATGREMSKGKSVVSGTVGNGAEEMFRNFMLNMPCVSTRGDGPNGKKIEGFLYGYKKKEDVKIVCVCHGNFLSPAEFVKHAGGGDVENPLRHIVIHPSLV